MRSASRLIAVSLLLASLAIPALGGARVPGEQWMQYADPATEGWF